VSEPKQKPHRSEQDVGTPPEFMRAVTERFGTVSWDLAATRANKVAPLWLGPGSKDGENSLAVDWAMLPGPAGTVKWLNPEFGNIAPFAKKCAQQAPAEGRGTIVMLVPASVGTGWFSRYVHRRALVLALSPRLTFVGHEHPFPKDLMVCVYGRWVVPAFDTWRWDGAAECPF
jgi:hypothetical protein